MKSKMKKLATFAIMFATVAILGTALTGAAPDEKKSSSDTVTSKVPAPDALKCEFCPNANCKGKCSKSAAKTLVAKDAASDMQKCKFCNEDNCKQQCGGCAFAGKGAADARSDEQIDQGAGKGMGKGAGMGMGKGMGKGAGMGMGKGMGKGMGMGRGHAGDSQHDKDHRDFFFLLEHRDAIHRTVKNIPSGIESLTESDDAEVAAMIQVHVEAMYDRVDNGNPIRMRDPIFREVFANADKIKMDVEHTENGVRVTETSTDAYVVKLLQEHAKVVSLWIKNGYSELPKNHPAPQK